MPTCGAWGLALWILLAASIGPAAAAGCAGARTQLALDQCAGDAFTKADDAPNLSYQTRMSRLKSQDETRKRLVAAQKGWLGFRDGECAFEAAGTTGGSVHPMIVTECRTRLTRARTEVLRGLLTCEEGDLSCPVPPK